MSPTIMRMAPASLRISLVESLSCCFSTALAARKAGNWSGPSMRGGCKLAALAGTAGPAAASSDIETNSSTTVRSKLWHLLQQNGWQNPLQAQMESV